MDFIDSGSRKIGTSPVSKQTSVSRSDNGWSEAVSSSHYSLPDDTDRHLPPDPAEEEHRRGEHRPETSPAFDPTALLSPLVAAFDVGLDIVEFTGAALLELSAPRMVSASGTPNGAYLLHPELFDQAQHQHRQLVRDYSAAAPVYRAAFWQSVGLEEKAQRSLHPEPYHPVAQLFVGEEALHQWNSEHPVSGVASGMAHFGLSFGNPKFLLEIGRGAPRLAGWALREGVPAMRHLAESAGSLVGRLGETFDALIGVSGKTSWSLEGLVPATVNGADPAMLKTGRKTLEQQIAEAKAPLHHSIQEPGPAPSLARQASPSPVSSDTRRLILEAPLDRRVMVADDIPNLSGPYAPYNQGRFILFDQGFGRYEARLNGARFGITGTEEGLWTIDIIQIHSDPTLAWASSPMEGLSKGAAGLFAARGMKEIAFQSGQTLRQGTVFFAPSVEHTSTLAMLANDVPPLQTPFAQFYRNLAHELGFEVASIEVTAIHIPAKVRVRRATPKDIEAHFADPAYGWTVQFKMTLGAPLPVQP